MLSGRAGAGGGEAGFAAGVATATAAGAGFTVGMAVAFAVTAGDGVAVGVLLGAGDGVMVAAGLADAVALGAGVGAGDGFALGLGLAVGVSVGCGVGAGAGVTSGVKLTCGTGVTIGADDGPAPGPLSRFWKADTSAPMPSPAITTPIANATVGNGPPPFPPPPLPPAPPRRDGGRGVGRRRGEGSDIASRFPRIRQEALPRHANAPCMIRVRVPIDVNAVLCADSTAFALATPLRVGELLTHAILEALGPRAPQDKRERAIAVAHAGLNDGAFILQIDERIYEHCDDVAVVAGIVTVRFFRRQQRSNAA